MSQQKRVRKTRKEQEKGEVLEQPLEEPPVRSQSAQLQIILQHRAKIPMKKGQKDRMYKRQLLKRR